METETLTVSYVGPHDEVVVPFLGRVVAQGETLELAGAEECEFGRGLLMQGATAVLDENGRHRTDEAGNDLYAATHAVWAPVEGTGHRAKGKGTKDAPSGAAPDAA